MRSHKDSYNSLHHLTGPGRAVRFGRLVMRLGFDCDVCDLSLDRTLSAGRTGGAPGGPTDLSRHVRRPLARSHGATWSELLGGGLQRGPSGDLLGMGRGRQQHVPHPLAAGRAGTAAGQSGHSPLQVLSRGRPSARGRSAGTTGAGSSEQPPPPQPSTPGPDIWFREPLPPSGNGSRHAKQFRLRPAKVARVERGWHAAKRCHGRQGFFPALAGRLRRITRLAQVGGVRTPSGVQVCVQGNTATVRGAVATPYQRSLVGDLVGLEPGVWHVNNQVIVVAAPGLATAEASRYRAACCPASSTTNSRCFTRWSTSWACPARLNSPPRADHGSLLHRHAGFGALPLGPTSCRWMSEPTGQHLAGCRTY